MPANQRDKQIEAHYTLLLKTAGVAVTYKRPAPAPPIALTAIRTSAIFSAQDEAGFVAEIESPDFIVRASDLADAGVLVEPATGDIISELEELEDNQERSVEYQVCNPGAAGTTPGQQSWRWSNPGRTFRRIHTKLAAEAPV